MDKASVYSVANVEQFQRLMYRPLYWYGVGSKAEINYAQSIANKPVYSNGDHTVTITLKDYKWSNGTSVTAQGVIFWLNLLKYVLAKNPTAWAVYSPGAFPNNLVSYSALNSHTVVLNLNKAYNQTWFTYNELSQIYPLPEAWDRTSMSGSASFNNSSTAAGAVAVYSFLNRQASAESTFATSKIWSVVDGPWRLKSFTTEGRAAFVPNKSYSGTTKPTLAEFVELPFTSNSSEFNVLASGSNAVSYGYLPNSEVPQLSRLKSSGYHLEPWINLGFNYFVENYHNPTYGSLFKQLYFRQSLQHLIDQSAYINHFYHGYAVPTYSPVPIQPANPFVDATSKHNPYPYSLSAAKNLLVSHGWKVVNGVMTCERPGNTATACGAGVSSGQTLNLNLQYEAGSNTLKQEMEAFASAAKQIGININLTTAPFDTVISDAASCSSTQAACKWQMENWGGGWAYGASPYPTGGELFGSGAGSNFGSYSSTSMDTLINNTHSSSNGQAALNSYQNFAALQLPVVYQPKAPYMLSMISDELKGVVQSPYLELNAQDWYFTK
jgi:peptide/nickel transport system substrate-binding protein